MVLYFNISPPLFISILLFAGLNQAFEPRCRTWPKNQNGTIIPKMEISDFYIRCEYQGNPPMDTNANSDILTKNRTLKEFIHQMQLENGDVIRIDFGYPWEDALYMNFHIINRMCDLATLELFLPFFITKSQKKR